MSTGEFVQLNKENEHILVCLSSSPSNEKIIRTAAKMARDMRARFTALYVQTGKRERESDKRRLEAHVQFAKESGAEIVMTHGENVPVQIAEYAHLSNVTKIVIGQSSAKRNHFFSKQTLTEKLIEAVPDIDIHIIPDAMNLDNYRKPHGAVYVGKPTMKDSLLTLFIFAVCTLIGLFIQKLQFTDTNIVTIYILGVLLTSILTDGYLYSIGGSVLSVFLFCFFLTEPRMSFQTYAVGYPVTFVIMLISSVITGTLAAKLKTHARLSAQSAFRTQILFDTDRLLQKAKNDTDILSITCTQLIKLLDRSIVAYVVEGDELSAPHIFSNKKKEQIEDLLTSREQEIAKWVYENKQRAGATTERFKDAQCLYLAICIEDNVYGVIAIPVDEYTLDSFEYSILLSVINECALAMENKKNIMEKEKISVLAKNEQLRADLLRAISHDLRTPLCSISGNADMLLNSGERLDDITKHQIYTDIYDDSEWLINIVENLLSITRLNDGRLKLKFTDQLLDEVIAESLRHISRKHEEYQIVTECDELILAHMDVRLILQVLINLVDNAIKYTPKGSTIRICAMNENGKAKIQVEDNGPGICDEMKPHIFEMFYTGKNTIADSHRSLGLGLALCRSIIEVHNGKLVLEDNIPHGCIFSFTLPLSSHKPEIILLDLGLPDMEGVDVIKKVRTWSNVPIIVISARSEDVDKIEALDAGADDYITKPFSVDELLARIRVTQRRLALIQSGEEQEQAVFVNGELKIDYTAGSTYLKDKELHLTPIEYKLLCLLSHNVGKVLTHTYITQQIWGSSLENDVASLRVFMATLRKKLQPDKDGMQYIQTHIGIGYRMLKI